MRRLLASFPVVALLMACGGDGADGAGGAGGAGGGGGGGGMGLVSAGAVLPCDPGELPQTDGSCLPPGVPADGCGQGFVASGDGACVATLPTNACAAGQLALPGESQCHAVSACGSGTWGDIPVDGSTVYVDTNYGGASNGSASSPYTTLQQAVSAAPSNATIAIAAGTYAESLVLTKPLSIWGRCPDMVALTGSGNGPTVRLQPGASGSQLHTLAVSGNGKGVQVDSVAGVVLDRLRIHDTGDIGLEVQQLSAATDVSLEGSLIEYVVDKGIVLGGGTLTLQDSSVRDVQHSATFNGGEGIYGYGYGTTAAALTLSHCVIERVSTNGIVTSGQVDTTVDDSLLYDILPHPTNKTDGQAIFARWESADGGARPTVTVRRSLVERSHWIAVHTNGAHLVMERSVIRDTQRRESDDLGGLAMSLFAIDLTGGLPEIASGRIHESTFDGAFVNGVELQGVEAEFVSSIVRNVDPKPDGTNGIGITAWDSVNNGDRTLLSMRGCRVEQTHQGGVAVGGSDAVIEDTAIVDTQPRELDGGMGVGLSLLLSLDSMVPSTGIVERTVVDGAHGGAIGVAGSDATMTDVLVRNVFAQQSTQDFGDGIGNSATLVWIPGLFPSAMTLTRATVDGVPRAGISTFGASVAIQDTLLWCNGIDLDGETIDGQAYEFEDLGGNECGCDGALHDCQMVSSNLKPPIVP